MFPRARGECYAERKSIRNLCVCPTCSVTLENLTNIAGKHP